MIDIYSNYHEKSQVVADPMAFDSRQRIIIKGGALVENITQTIARDILRDALLRLEDNFYDIVMHYYDEIIIQIDEVKDPNELQKILDIVIEAPCWAKGLQIVAEGWRAKQYKKQIDLV